MTALTTPISEATVRALKVGDEGAISGVVFTGLRPGTALACGRMNA